MAARMRLAENSRQPCLLFTTICMRTFLDRPGLNCRSWPTNSMLYALVRVMGMCCCMISCTHDGKGQTEGDFRPKHNIGLNIGHAHSLHGVEEDGSSKTLILPYWGFDYNFQFAQRFALGVHVDYINEDFEVEKNLASGSQTVERSRPVAPALVGFYKPGERWSVGLGIGGEFSKEENYLLNRGAVEYGVEIRKGWEVFGVLQYDIRWNAYDTWTIGLGISKAFGKRNRDEKQ